MEQRRNSRVGRVGESMAASFVDAGRAEGDFSGCYLCWWRRVPPWRSVLKQLEEQGRVRSRSLGIFFHWNGLARTLCPTVRKLVSWSNINHASDDTLQSSILRN